MPAPAQPPTPGAAKASRPARPSKANQSSAPVGQSRHSANLKRSQKLLIILTIDSQQSNNEKAH